VDLGRSEAPSELLRELVAHLRQNRTQLREEWVVRIPETEEDRKRCFTTVPDTTILASYTNHCRYLHESL
jgi:hypothetical protein